jgi:hypothetical protein
VYLLGPQTPPAHYLYDLCNLQEDAHFSAMLDESQQIIFALRTEVQKVGM